MLVWMPRFYVRDLNSNLRRLAEECDAAAQAGCDLVLFPELLLTAYKGENDPPRFREIFAQLSTAHPAPLFVFGTLSEERHNRMLVYSAGQPLAQYDKVHLFPPTGEPELWEHGARYVALTHNGLRIGLGICNDVRFPEQTRALKLKCDIQLMLYCALWPWQRDHIWRTLLQARAIENGVFTLGCCLSGIDNGVERLDGAGNYAFDPLGAPVYPDGCLYRLDLARLSDVLVDTRALYSDVTQVELIEGP